MPLVNAINPLESFISKRVKHKVPLKKTSYDIEIVSGLAIVNVTRVFKNEEKRPIEATMTFPFPFNATVYSIEAKVDGRVLTGHSQPVVEARETYEAAIDNGKRAVLHEELLRGLHMLSVGNVAADVEIEVTASFVMPVSLSKGNGSFRIPLTVGQIYGNSPLDDSDDLVTGGEVAPIVVTLKTETGSIKVNNNSVNDEVIVQSNRPIDVKINDLYTDILPSLSGVVGNGSEVVNIDFKPLEKQDASLNISLLLDVSGSMNERVSDGTNKTKWETVLDSFDDLETSALKSSANILVSTFSNECIVHGSTSGNKIGQYIRSLNFVGGGTNIDKAVKKVVNHSSEANVLLITDGKSYNKIDVQEAIRSGARFTVVLVGEDSLEVNVGYLAAMTGGQMFVAQGKKVKKSIVEAVKSMTNVSSPIIPLSEKPTSITRQISGVEYNVKWKYLKGKSSSVNDPLKRAIGAFAANLAVQAMDKESGAKYAAEAGLVTHLTSIVLVDEEAEAVNGIPATRKIPLATPATASMGAMRGLTVRAPSSSPILASGAPSMSFASSNAIDSAATMAVFMSSDPKSSANGDGIHRPVLTGDGPLGKIHETKTGDTWPSVLGGIPEFPKTVYPKVPTDQDMRDYNIDLDKYRELIEKNNRIPVDQNLKKKYDPKAVAQLVLNSINWDDAPDFLVNGDISRVSQVTQIHLIGLSKEKTIEKLAKSLNTSELVALIGLLANQAKRNRTAARIARAILSEVKLKKLYAANEALGFIKTADAA